MVIRIAPHPAGAAGHDLAVHAPRDAHSEALHAVGEEAGVDGFDEHVEVVVLDRVVDDAKAVPSGVADGPLQQLVKAVDAEAR